MKKSNWEEDLKSYLNETVKGIVINITGNNNNIHDVTINHNISADITFLLDRIRKLEEEVAWCKRQLSLKN